MLIVALIEYFFHGDFFILPLELIKILSTYKGSSQSKPYCLSEYVRLCHLQRVYIGRPVT